MDITCRYSRGMQISPVHYITDLEYIDDIVLYVDNYNEMQKLRNVSTIAVKIGLRIIVSKMKVFSSYIQNIIKYLFLSVHHRLKNCTLNILDPL